MAKKAKKTTKRSSRRSTGARRGEARVEEAGVNDAGASDVSAAGAGDELPPMPRSREELVAWVRAHVGITMADRALIDGHAAPLDYLCHAFFEPGMSGGDEAGGAAAGGAHDAVRDCVVWANRGGGKTFLGAVATLLDLVYKPGIEIRILAGSIEQAGRMHAHLRRLLARPVFEGLVRGKTTDRRVELRTHSRVEVLAQSQASIRGTRVQKLRCDEVDLFTRDAWEAAQLVTRSTRCGEILVRGSIDCLSTMHRPHGVMRELVAEAHAGRRRLFQWGVVDTLEACGPEHACQESREPDGRVVRAACPLLDDCGGRAKREGHSGFVPIRDAITLKGRVSVATWTSEMLSVRPRRTDAVYAEFDPVVHVRAEMDEVEALARSGAVPLVAGMDFGYRNPSAVVLAVLESASDTLYVLDEWIKAGLTVDAHAEAITSGLGRGWPVPAWIGVDPAGVATGGQTGTSPVQDLRAKGLVIRVRRSRVLAGVELVRARLAPAAGAPRLFVHARCRGLIEALEKYHYSEEDPTSEAPVKDGADHACDALRYMVHCLDKPYQTRGASYLSGGGGGGGGGGGKK